MSKSSKAKKKHQKQNEAVKAKEKEAESIVKEGDSEQENGDKAKDEPDVPEEELTDVEKLAEKIRAADPKNPMTEEDLQLYDNHRGQVEEVLEGFFKEAAGRMQGYLRNNQPVAPTPDITPAVKQEPEIKPAEELTDIIGTFAVPLKSIYGADFDIDNPQLPPAEMQFLNNDPEQGLTQPEIEDQEPKYKESDLLANIRLLLEWIYKIDSTLDDPEKVVVKDDALHKALKNTLAQHGFVPAQNISAVLPENHTEPQGVLIEQPPIQN